MMPVFRLQIVDHEGIVVNMAGGGPVEADLVQHIIESVLAHGQRVLIQACLQAIRHGKGDMVEAVVVAATRRGIGALRGQAHTQQAIRDALEEAWRSDIRVENLVAMSEEDAWALDPLIRGVVGEGVRVAIQDVKDRSREVR